MTKLLLTLAAGLLITVTIVGFMNRHRFRYRPAPLSDADLHALAQAPGFAADEAQVAPGVVLRGLVRRPADAQAPWLFFLPGNGNDVLRGAQDLLQRLAGERDIGLAVWAYRGFDGSTGVPRASDLAADSEQLRARLQAEFGVSAARLHLVSFSLGTALALQLAALLEANGTPPASLVLLSPYERLQVTQDVWWAPWTFADEYDAVLHAGDSNVEALLVHGASDDAVPVQAARALAQVMGTRATLIELPGRGHADWLGDDSVLAKVRAFIDARSAR